MCILMGISSLLEIPRTESPPNPAPEDEPLSTNSAEWFSVLTDRMWTKVVFRGPG